MTIADLYDVDLVVHYPKHECECDECRNVWLDSIEDDLNGLPPAGPRRIVAEAYRLQW